MKRVGIIFSIGIWLFIGLPAAFAHAETGEAGRILLPQSGIAVPRMKKSAAVHETTRKNVLQRLPETKTVEVPVEQEPLDELEFEVRVRPRVPALFAIDSETGALSLDERSPGQNLRTVPQAVADAADRIAAIDADWAVGFLARMAQIHEERAVALSDVLLSNEDARLDDEIAWVLSHMPPEDLRRSALRADMIRRNAELIYAQAEKLDYVEIVEEAPFTTLRYTLKTADATESWLLPADIYYRAVVNMTLDWETPASVRPESGMNAAPPDGAFWRSYFLDAGEPPRSYAAHPTFTDPNDLHGDNYPGFRTTRDAVFTGMEVGVNELLLRAEDHGIAMMEFTRGDGACCSTMFDYPDGSYLATLAPVERLALDGSPELLENMLTFLNGGTRVAQYTTVVLVKDRDPYGQPVVENLLTDMGATLTVITSADLADFDLNWQIRKVVLPSDQPLSFWQAIADNKDKLEGFVDEGGVLELHGAVDQEEDVWDGLVMPGGFTRTTHSAPARADLLEGGLPKLSELLANTAAVWDGEAHEGLSGDRLFDPDTFALDKLGYWVSQMLVYWVSEWATLNGWNNVQRVSQPVQISNNRYGNCGELQDMLGAASRAALVPNLLVHNSTEDHVWNMFYLRDAWHPYQVSWSDGPTHIDNNKIAYDKDSGGGGKDCSCIIATEGDGTVRSVAGMFSNTLTLNLHVTDADGRPVDGASVSVATEAWQSEDLMTGIWGETDDQGRWTAELGDGANYYLRVETPAGSYPPEAGAVSSVITAEEALPDESFDIDHAFDFGRDDIWPLQTGDQPADWEERYVLEGESEVADAMILGENAYTGGTTYIPAESPEARWVLLSEQQAARFVESGMRQGVDSAVGERAALAAPAEGNWFLALIPDAYGKEAVIRGTLRIWHVEGSDPPVDGDAEMERETEEPLSDGDEFPDGDEDFPMEEPADGDESDDDDETQKIGNGSGGGGCQSSPGTAGSAFLLIPLAALATRRKRRKRPMETFHG